MTSVTICSFSNHLRRGWSHSQALASGNECTAIVCWSHVLSSGRESGDKTIL